MIFKKNIKMKIYFIDSRLNNKNNRYLRIKFLLYNNKNKYL